MPRRYQTEYGTLYLGDVRDSLRALPDNSVHCVVTSPPYWGLRDYGLPPSVWGGDPDCEHEWGAGRTRHVSPESDHGHGGLANKTGTRGHQSFTRGSAGTISQGCYCQRCGAWRGCLGAEPTLAEYVQNMVDVFREVRRVLRPDGTLWLNLGDGRTSGGRTHTRDTDNKHLAVQGEHRRPYTPQGLKEKDLLGMPWRIAFALQEVGWYLRADVIWHKPNPKPESVTDRPTASHEYVFLLSKSPRYYYDGYAVREPSQERASGNKVAKMPEDIGRPRDHLASSVPYTPQGNGRNRRSVWTIPTKGYRGAHFATYPEALVTPCILAGTSAGGCCPHCKTPWGRAVSIRYVKSSVHGAGSVAGRREASGQNNLDGALMPRRAKRVTTLGFRPACDCGQHSPCPACNGAGRKLANPLAAINAARKRAAETGKPCKPIRRWSPCRACLGAGFPRVEWPEPVPCTVLDPFLGSGTTAAVAVQHGRHWAGCELNPDYVAMAIDRIASTQSRLLHECA